MLGEDDDAESSTPLKVFMGVGGLLTECSPPETQTIYVSIDGEPRFAGYVYTAPGELSCTLYFGIGVSAHKNLQTIPRHRTSSRAALYEMSDPRGPSL